MLELGKHNSVSHAGWLFALLGAEVVTVRTSAQSQDGNTVPGQPSRFEEFIDGGKRSLIVDFNNDRGLAEVSQLADSSDIIIDALGVGFLEQCGIDITITSGSGVLVRVSPFGQSGPWAQRVASNLTIQAAAGMVQWRGKEGTSPIRVGGRTADAGAGTHIATSALLALRSAADKKRTVVDVSLLECYFHTLPYLTRTMDTRIQAGRGAVELTERPLGVVRCADGWVGINILTGKQWIDMCALLGLPEFEDKWGELRLDPQLLRAFNEGAEKFLLQTRAEDIVEICQAMRIPANFIGSPDTMISFPQWVERNFFIERTDEESTWQQPSAPWRLEDGTVLSGRPAPVQDELREMFVDFVDRPKVLRSQPASDPQRPLEGVRVLDLTSFWAGGILTSPLGAFGADVIKVESIQRPDSFRYTMNFSDFGPDWYEFSGVWQSVNLNKRNLTLNLQSPEGQEIVRRLVASADVIAENYSTRVMESFGLTFEEIHALNPHAIVVRMPGYGLEGPWKDHVGWGNAFEQIGGSAWVTGEPHQPPTTPGGYIDALVGTHAAVALLGALREPAESRRGQLIEVPQMEVMACVSGEQIVEWSSTGVVAGRHGNAIPGNPVEVVLQSVNPLVWVAVSAENDSQLRGLCSVLNIDSVATSDEKLNKILSMWVARKLPEDAVEVLAAGGVPAAIVETPQTIRSNPQLRHRNFWQIMEREVTGSAAFGKWPYKMTPGSDGSHRLPAANLGQHNSEILMNELGLQSAEYRNLENSAVIGTKPIGVE